MPFPETGIDVRLDGELIDAEGEPIAKRLVKTDPTFLVLLRRGGPSTHGHDPTEPMVHRTQPRWASWGHG